MRRNLLFFIVGLMLISIVAGCGASAKEIPKTDAQVKVINTYMEALRDYDKDKLMSVLDTEVSIIYLKDPDSLDSLFNEQKKMGTLKKWTPLLETAYVDELNGQTLIEVEAVYSQKTFKLQCDIRKLGDDWKVFSVVPVSKSNKAAQQ